MKRTIVAFTLISQTFTAFAGGDLPANVSAEIREGSSRCKKSIPFQQGSYLKMMKCLDRAMTAPLQKHGIPLEQRTSFWMDGRRQIAIQADLGEISKAEFKKLLR